MVLTVLTGVAYPLVVTGLSQALFPHQANGSLIPANGKIVGSELIGQKFTKPEYFHGRPRPPATMAMTPLNSGATNLGPTNQALVEPCERRYQEIPPGKSHLHGSRFLPTC